MYDELGAWIIYVGLACIGIGLALAVYGVQW